ncbi:MAG: MFS transporter [Pseudomonadota bacterium]
MLGVNERTRRWWILGSAAGVYGLVVLDETIVGVALVAIRGDLSMSLLASHWVVNAYLLTFTCFVAVGGRLGDTLGHRTFFVVGAAIFGLSSLAGGFSPWGEWLIATRALQGVGAAIIFPAALAMVTDAFPPGQRGTAVGIQTNVAAVFLASGPLLGGLFTDYLSWRWIFWANLPIVVLVALAAFAAQQPAPKSKKDASPGDAHALDFRGLITLVVGLGALVISLMQASIWGWDAWATLALFAAGLLAIATFVLVEMRIRRPLIQIALLGIGAFTGGNLAFFMLQFGKVTVFVFVALYLQEVRQVRPVDAGILLMVSVAPTLFMAFMAGRLSDRYGSRLPLLAALSVNGLGLVCIGLAASVDSIALILVPMIFWGATLPMVSVPARLALMNAVPAEERGQAGGVNLTIQMLGGTVGVAICSAVLLATGDYRMVFLMVGGLTLATMAIVSFMVR